MSDADPPGGYATDHTRTPLLPDRPRVLMIGSDGYVQSTIGCAQQLLREVDTNWRQLVLLGGETFPFRPRPSTIMIEGMPPGVIASAPPLEEWGIASRLASPAGLPGCYEGDVVELARLWLETLQPETLAKLQLVSIGPTPGVEQLAAKANVPLLATATTPSLSPLSRS